MKDLFNTLSRLNLIPQRLKDILFGLPNPDRGTRYSPPYRTRSAAT